jgi:solute:Na+ symporter, SSS family
VTSLLAVMLAVFAAFTLYIAAQSAKSGDSPAAFVDAGQNLPGWTYIFAGSGALLASVGPYDYLRLLSVYGFQANQLALSLILVALVMALFQKRLWLAARMTGSRSLGEVLGAHYQSTSIRIYVLVVLLLFAVPFAATLLGSAGELLAQASGGALSRAAAISALAAFLFLASALGGWRATIYIIAVLSTVILALLIFSASFAGLVFDGLSVFHKGFSVREGILGSVLPGVIQFSSGIGREVPAGGLWTTTAVLSFALAAAGAALSPSFAFLGLTMKSRAGFAFSQVWIVSGLAAGALLLLGPIVAGEMNAADNFTLLVARFAAYDQLVAACVTVMLLVMLLVAVAFFAASGASVATIELLDRYIVPDLTPRGERLAARVSLAIIYAAIVLLAAFLPALATVLSTLALPLSAQLFAAYLGLCWLRWMSRSAVLVGLAFGILFVVFTEPPGLIVFDGLFVQLPWGRWPLTIHSAAWGLAINVGASLLVAIFTRQDAEREHRNVLHGSFQRDHRIAFGGRAARSAKWSLTLLWVFLALGPGAILGNSFFAHPVFTEADIALGVPSLWVWQAFFWIIGVLLVWWLAYRSRLSTVEGAFRPHELRHLRRQVPGTRRQLRWIALLVTRLTARQNRTTQPARRLR